MHMLYCAYSGMLQGLVLSLIPPLNAAYSERLCPECCVLHNPCCRHGAKSVEEEEEEERKAKKAAFGGQGDCTCVTNEVCMRPRLLYLVVTTPRNITCVSCDTLCVQDSS